MKNYLITGRKKIGKTFLITEILKKNKINPAGYFVFPKIDDNGNRDGYYYHSLSPVVKFKNDACIFDEKNIFKEVFNNLGLECLENSLNVKNEVLVLDELGRFEKNEKSYINLIEKILSSDKFVLAVLKKEEIEYISRIKNRDDVIIIDLDEINYDEAFKILDKALNLYLKRRDYEKNIDASGNIFS